MHINNHTNINSINNINKDIEKIEILESDILKFEERIFISLLFFISIYATLCILSFCSINRNIHFNRINNRFFERNNEMV